MLVLMSAAMANPGTPAAPSDAPRWGDAPLVTPSPTDPTGTPVVADGSPDVAVATVADRTGTDAEDLSALPLDGVIAPGVPGAAPCAGPPVRQDDLRAWLAEVVAEYDAGHFAVARERAAALAGATACLTDPIDPGWSWSASFVTGLIAWGDGDREAALRAWVAARGVDPHRPWDDNFAPGDALGTFATAVPASMVPFRAVGGPFLVDGRPAPELLPAGPHVLQAGDPLQTWLVEVDGPLVAVHPAADPRGLPVEDLAAVLGSRLAGQPSTYVVRGDEVLEVDLATGVFHPVLPPAEPSPTRKRGRLRGALAASAGGILVAGGALQVALGGLAAHQARVDMWAAYEDDAPSAQAEAEGRWTSAWQRIDGGAAAGGAGVVLVAVGAIDLARR